MRPISYVARGEFTSPKWCRAFAAGCGGQLLDNRYPVSPYYPMALFGSVKLWDQFQRARARGVPWYYGDHAYFRRFEFYRVTRNAYMHDGVDGEPDYVRLLQLKMQIKPWRRGTHVLVCPPDAAFASIMGFDAGDWTSTVMRKLSAATDRPIRWRSRIGAEGKHSRALLEDLRGCHALVTYTSNAAVEAILEGVPVIVTGQCAASSMGLSDPSDVEDVVYPDHREEWAAKLAANQWTLSEIESGDCWRAIGRENQDNEQLQQLRPRNRTPSRKRMAPSKVRASSSGLDEEGG